MKKLPIFLTAIVAAAFNAGDADAVVVGGQSVETTNTQPVAWVSTAEQLSEPEDGLNILPNDFFDINTLDLEGIFSPAPIPNDSYLVTPEVKRVVNGFNEVQNYTLTDDLPLGLIPGGDFGAQDWTENPYSLSAGTTINSHYFFYWAELPPDRVQSYGGNNMYIEIELEFENTILGVMGNAGNLLQSHSFLGLDNVDYFQQARFSLDTRGVSADDIVTAINRNTMSIYLNIATGPDNETTGRSSNVYDQFRVFTAVETTEVPEPLTILGSTAAVLWGGFLKKQKRKK